MCKSKITSASKTALKLYYLTDGPPSLTVRQALEYLKVPHEIVHVDYYKGEHLTPEYEKKNPQKETPLLEDDGFYLSESNAMLQYIAEKFKPDSDVYPKDVRTRAIVNHRLNFNGTSLYPRIVSHAILPIFFDVERTAAGQTRMEQGLDVFNTYLKRQGTKYAAADHLTIADFPLVNTIMCLEVVRIGLEKYPEVDRWYKTFKKEYPVLWKISQEGMEILRNFELNPPDLSFMDDGVRPIRKPKK